MRDPEAPIAQSRIDPKVERREQMVRLIPGKLISLILAACFLLFSLAPSSYATSYATSYAARHHRRHNPEAGKKKAAKRIGIGAAIGAGAGGLIGGRKGALVGAGAGAGAGTAYHYHKKHQWARRHRRVRG